MVCPVDGWSLVFEYSWRLEFLLKSFWRLGSSSESSWMLDSLLWRLCSRLYWEGSSWCSFFRVVSDFPSLAGDVGFFISMVSFPGVMMGWPRCFQPCLFSHLPASWSHFASCCGRLVTAGVFIGPGVLVRVLLSLVFEFGCVWGWWHLLLIRLIP